MAEAERETIEGRIESLRALAHPVRLQILRAVAGEERAVGEIEAETGIGQPGLSQQLAVLRKAELVLTRRTGKQVYYRIDGAGLASLGRALADLGGTVLPESVAPPEPAAMAPAPLPSPAQDAGAARFARVLR